MIKHALLLVGGVMVLAQSAFAQAPPSSTTPQAPSALMVSSADCAPAKPVPSRRALSPEGTTIGQANEPLSDQLARSDGVLCPPADVDPEIRAPTPDAGNMPVIPPPGSPGGNPNLRPK